MTGKPGRSGGWRRVNKPKPQPEMLFVGTPAPPTVCLRERCGQPVTIHRSSDLMAPATWSCVVGHGGVVNVKPEIRQEPNQIPKGTCQRCGIAPVPAKRRRGGVRGGYCDDCIEQGRRLFAEETETVR